MVEINWNHEKVNSLLRGRCSNSCLHYDLKTPECWKTCETASEYIEDCEANPQKYPGVRRA